MSDSSKTDSKRSSYGRRVAVAAGALVVVLLGSVAIAQRFSDGPLSAIIPGGALRAGNLVTDADLVTVLGDRGTCVDGVCAPMDPIELQLVDPPTSRYIGIMVREGEVYLPCDLGFMWGRFEGNQRTVLHLIYLFKRWHEDAQRDGRVMLRLDGKRFERQAVRVMDPALIAALRAQLEEMGRAWVAPEPLGAAPTEGPRDIWFFRLEPRSAT